MCRIAFLLMLLLGVVIPASAAGVDGDEIAGFYAFDPTFTGGASVGVCGPDRSGVLYVVAGAGPGGLPQVRVFALNLPAAPLNFLAYEAGFTGGVSVACVVHDTDLFVTTGALAGGGPHVRVFRFTTFNER